MIRNRLMMCVGCILLIAQDCSSDAKKENQNKTLRIVRIEAPVTGRGELFSNEIYSNGYLLGEGNVEDMQLLMQTTATPNSMLFNQMIQDDEWGTSSISNGIETISLIPYTSTPPSSPIPPNSISDIVLSTQFSNVEV